MILPFQNEINVIAYIVEKKFKLNFNHFIWTKFQQNMNFQNLCFVMFKMKHLIHRMQFYTLSKQV